MTKKVEKKVSKREEKMNQLVSTFGENYQVYIKSYRSDVSLIKREMGKVENSYLTMAFALCRINNDKTYIIDGYKNIYDFAQDKFNLGRSTCNNFISIVSTYSSNGLELDEQYKGFSSTQLVVLLPHIRQGGSLEGFTPDMSSRKMLGKIKELKSIDGQSEDSRGGDNYCQSEIRPEKFVFCVTEDLMKSPGNALDAFYSEVRATVSNAFSKYGARSVKIVIEDL